MFEVSIKSFSLPFNVPFSITHGTRNSLETVRLDLSAKGLTGFGEIPIIPYYDISIAQIFKLVQGAGFKGIPKEALTPSEMFSYFKSLFEPYPFILAAFDVAYHDWYGKYKDMAVWEVLGLQKPSNVKTNYTISMGSFEEMSAQIEENPWPNYKLKMGPTAPYKTFEKLLHSFPAVFRIDANTGWDAVSMLEHTSILGHERLELLEQPLPVDDWAGMEQIKGIATPLIADESCQSLGDIDKCAKYFDGINIKLAKCGGVTPALEMIKKAKSLGLKVMLGSMAESTIAISPVYHLASLVDYIDIDGPMLLKENLADGISFSNGVVHIGAEVKGLGFSVV